MTRKSPRNSKHQKQFDWAGWLVATLANYSPCARCGCFFIYHKQKSTYMRHKWRIGQTDGMLPILAKTSCDCPYCLCFCVAYVQTIPSQKWTHCLYDPHSNIKPLYEKTSFRVVCEYCHSDPCICHVLIHIINFSLALLHSDSPLEYKEETIVRPITNETQPESMEATGGSGEVRPVGEGTEDTSWFSAPRIRDGKKGTGAGRKVRK